MKRKIALLLAMAMTLSLLSMNVFAASTFRPSRTVTVVNENTLFVETTADFNLRSSAAAAGTIGTLVSAQSVVYQFDREVDTDNVANYTYDGDAEYVVEGVDLVFTLQDNLYDNSQFRITLDGASWAFGDKSTTGTKLYDGSAPFAFTTPGSLTNPIEAVQTYDGNKGNFSGYKYTRIDQGDTDKTLSGTAVEYYLEVSGFYDNVATITISGAAARFGTNYYPAKNLSDQAIELVVPLVILTGTDGDVKVAMESGSSSISQSTWIIGQTSGGKTTTKVNEPQTAYDTFLLDEVHIKELKLNSINSGKFELRAPTGYRFVDPDDDDIEMWMEYGLSGWANKSPALTIKGTRGSKATSDWDIQYRQFKSNNVAYYDESVLVVTVNNITKSTRLLGELIIKNLKLIADENAGEGDIKVRIIDETNSTEYTDKSGAGVSDEYFLAGTRKLYAITLSAATPIPTLVNGRYEDTNSYSFDTEHKTAKVTFQENSPAAWWSNRQTIFTLPDEVKFIKVDITDADELAGKYEDRLKGVYEGNGLRDDLVTVDGSTMTWSSINVNSNKRAVIKMNIWVSIASGYEEDVILTVSGSSVPDEVAPSAVIAKAISPITVKPVSVTDVKIGYQYQQTADIEIIENKAGALMRGKQVRISVTDMISTDLYLTPDTKYEVAGDLKINSYSTGVDGTAGSVNYLSSYRLVDATSFNSSNNSTSANLGVGGTITFNISAASSKVSTITIKNVAVKVDRTVPVSNDRPIKVIVWGTAVAANYGTARPMFQVPGISEDYINNVSAAGDTSTFSQEVRVSIGENVYYVNGEAKDMDAAAYISTDSNSTMVPVRFIANAFGIEDNQIIWDPENKTATIIHPTKIVQFTAGNNYMIIDGANVAMVSPDGLTVKAEITSDRMYIPFRALGEAFGVPVGWDGETQTAIYNEK